VLAGIDLLTHEELGYWEERGYDQDAGTGHSYAPSPRPPTLP
jgi:hypothetical protein